MEEASMKKGPIIGFVVVVAIIALVIVFVQGYNKAPRMEEGVKNAWGNVENVLQRRMDLIPNLVETVKGYATHEQKVFDDLAEARTHYNSAQTPKGKLEANSELEGALGRLMVIVENYPNLKANEVFLKLQDELAGTENRIAVERKRYNDELRTFRSYARSLTGGIFMKIRGIDYNEYEYFQAPEAAKTAPAVKFND
jgi:LemA protein